MFSEIKSIRDERVLDEVLSRPYPEDVEVAARLEGDVVVLGAGGKMGPTLVLRILRAIAQAGKPARVYAVSRFSDAAQKEKLERAGAAVLSKDLLDAGDLASIPRAPDVIYMAGTKFGSTGRESLTWAMNAYLPGRVADHFRGARIVAFSTGNVYPLVPVESGGSRESDDPGPIGEYAQSCLGRERVLEHFSSADGTPMCILRLNYAVELRYGVLLDIARKIYSDSPVPVSMGYVNVIWQGDANSVCWRALEICRSPADVLNLTGPGILSVRHLAQELGRRLGRQVRFVGEEAPTALLNDAERCLRLFGEPRVPVEQVLDWVARWVENEGPVLGKPTKFEVRDGKF